MATTLVRKAQSESSTVTLQSSHQDRPIVTPNKRKDSPLRHQVSMNQQTPSRSGLVNESQQAGPFLKTPDQPYASKRPRSAPARTDEAVRGSKDRSRSDSVSTKQSPCRTEKYKYEAPRLHHIEICPKGSECPHRKHPHESGKPDKPARGSFGIQDPQIDNSFVEKLRKAAGERAISEEGDISAETLNEMPSPSDTSGNGVSETMPGSHNASNEARADTISDEETSPTEEEDSSEIPQQSNTTNSKTTRDSSGKDDTFNIPTIRETLRKKLRQDLGDDQRGHIYIMRNPEKSGLYKIGKSVHPLERSGQIKVACGHKVVLVDYFPAVLHTRTESLVKLYLSDLCRPYRCAKCNKTHEEWFEVSEKLAIATVKRWVSFIDNEMPYDVKSKKLARFWSDRLDRHNFGSADIDFDILRLKWDACILPSQLEHLQFWYRFVREVVSEFFWPVFATLGWTMAFIAMRSPIAFCLLSSSVVGTFFSMSDALHALK